MNCELSMMNCELRTIKLFLLCLLSLPLSAQEGASSVLQNTTFGGYVIGQMSATDQPGAEKQTDMNLRLIRVYADSRLGDWAFKLQAQVNGNTSSLSSPRVVEAWAEWQHWKEFRIKFGQMKRPFTFENPMHPWLIGKGNYSQLTLKMAGFNDRTGEHASNGRDFGLQFQGDLLRSRSDGHAFLHYQVGVFTGQGINFSDRNTRKDIIGGIWVAPVKNLQVGAFGWTGNYVDDSKLTHERRRYSFGLNYTGSWTARAEYAVDNAEGKADAWYALVGTPEWKRSKVFLFYDVLREAKSWDNAHSIYGLSAQHSLHKNLMLQLNYGFHARATAGSKRHYNTADVQLYWRF